MLNKVIFLIIVFAAISFPVAAQNESVSLRYRDQPGRWFPRPMVDEMQKELQELDTLKGTVVPSLEVKLDLRMKRIQDLRLAIDATTTALETSKKALATSEKLATDSFQRAMEAEQRAIDAEEKNSKWYRHPATWAGVGVVLTIVVEVVVYSIIK